MKTVRFIRKEVKNKKSNPFLLTAIRLFMKNEYDLEISRRFKRRFSK
jgi:hypothetical protein